MLAKRFAQLVTSAVLVSIFVISFTSDSSYAATFRQGMLEGYNNMPSSLPDDRDLYPGSTGLAGKDSSGNYIHHQYITVAGGNIDDAGGNKTGNDYRRASFVLYATDTSFSKSLSVTFVDRAVNVDGPTSTCNGVLEIGVMKQAPAAVKGDWAHEKVKENNSECGKSVPTQSLVINENNFVEITMKDSAGNDVPSGIYKAYVNVAYFSGSGSQASFRINAPGAKIGYQDWQWTNMYATKFANGHTMSFKWRPPCGEPSSASGTESGRIFTYADGDQGNASIQPSSAGATRDRIRAGAKLGSDTLREYEQVIIPHNQLSSGVWNSEAVNLNRINGGNGISFNYPYESGNYYFDVCPPPPPSPPPAECTKFTMDFPNVSEGSIYRFSVFYSNNEYLNSTSPAENAVQPNYTGWYRSYSEGPKKQVTVNTNDVGDPYSFDYPDDAKYSSQRKVYIERWKHTDTNNNGTIEWQYSIVSELVSNCPTQSPPVSWWVQHYRGGSGIVELGQTANYNFSFYNRWGNDAYPNSAMESNYNYDNPSERGDPASNGGFAWGYNQSGAINPIPYEGDDKANRIAKSLAFSTTIPTDVSALGKNYCQRFWVNPAQVLNDRTTIGKTYSEHPSGESSQCFQVVGGKTDIGVSAAPAEVEPEEVATFDVTISTSAYSGGGGYGGYDANCSWVLYSVPASGSPTSRINDGSCTKRVTSAKAETATVNYSVPDSIEEGSRICLQATLSLLNDAFYADPAHRSDAKCVPVVSRPYFKVYGGDISAGNGFDGVCLQNSSVLGWNRNTGPAYAGSGVQYAIYAQGIIKGVAAGQGLPVQGDFGYAPSRLTFANTGIGSLESDEYGGKLGAGSCTSDYFSSKPQDGSVKRWFDLGDSNSDAYGYTRNFEADGPLVIYGKADDAANYVAQGNNTKVYIDGDVYINSDIIAESGAESFDQIPNFMLVVKGNIYIDAAVGSLYGTYIAQPKDNGQGGTIYTCARRNGNEFVYSAVPDGEVFTRCNKQLKVTGSFVANAFELKRTNGSLYKDKGGSAFGGSGSASAAEIFQYNPLAWTRQSITSTTNNNDDFDSISTLPPVL
jgi:hypothetical protein